ncbi:MAG: diaminopimelate epimerase [Gemmatimonadota bacterium]|nr:diaminopimelate epimerase [Gemmatimonadota bacterium]
MTTRFWKMTGSGNDFVFVDGRVTAEAEWPPERIAAVCDRRNGAGGDGLVVLTPQAAESVRMAYFNADGSAAAMCGNAALCSTRLAARLGMVRGPEMTLLTAVGPMHTRLAGNGQDAEINLGDTAVPRPVDIALKPGEHAILLGTVGVPHLVVLVDDVAAVDVQLRGRELRWDLGAGPTGANANFVSPPLDASGGRWRIRTFERGVEGETLACGTGTVAAALALIASDRASSPVDFVSWGGMPLGVRARVSGGRAVAVWLRGEGRLVYEGCFSEF